jgi:rubrerythrin
MTQIKPDNEVLEFAISREVEAHNFYLALAERMDNPQLCQMLEDFAQEELEHKAKLEMELIKNGIVVDTAQKDNSFQASDYIISDEATIGLDYKDLLEICIQKEDASFRFYVDMLPQAQDKSTNETLLAIIEDEIKHKLRFETEYEKLIKKSAL